MKAPACLLCFLMLLLACSPSNHSATNTSQVSGGYFTGTALFQLVYLKIMDSLAVADFVVVEKMPRSYYSDTLLYNSKEEIWQGKNSRLYRKRNSYFISLSSSGKGGKIKLKPNEEYYKQSIDQMKNRAFARQDYENYHRQHLQEEEIIKYERLQKSFGIAEKTVSLKHPDFLKEFEKFSTALATE